MDRWTPAHLCLPTGLYVRPAGSPSLVSCPRGMPQLTCVAGWSQKDTEEASGARPQQDGQVNVATVAGRSPVLENKGNPGCLDGLRALVEDCKSQEDI